MVNAMMNVFWNGVKKGVGDDLLELKASFMRIGPFIRDCWQATLASLVGAAIAITLLPYQPLLIVAVNITITSLILAFTSGLFSIKLCK